MKIDNITFCLVNNARRRPHHVALISKDETVDYRTLELRVQRYAGALRATIDSGEIVGVSMHDSIDQVVVIFALARIGAIMLPMDRRWTSAERDTVGTAFGWRVVISDTPIDVPAAVRSIEINGVWKKASENAPAVTTWSTTAESPLALSLSSGTTGVPKGPLVTHGLYMSRMYYESMAVSSTQDDLNMCALPLYFGAGRNITLQHVMMGATVVLYPPPYEIEDLVREINERRIDTVFLVPTLLRRLLKLPDIPPPLFPHLRVLISGAAALYEEEARQVRRRLTPKLYVCYGTTEGGVVSYLSPENDDSKLGSVGLPAFLCDVQVVDEHHKPVAKGEIGRVSFSTMAVPGGFYNNPEASAESFHEGRFLPGDLGRFDEDGYLYIVGRSKEMIIRGGVNIYPADIESSLSSHESVVDVSVVGWPVGEMGEEVAAVVVTKNPVSESELIEHCRGQLAKYKLPRRIFFIKRLPRNDGGKVSKKLLAELLPKTLEGALNTDLVP